MNKMREEFEAWYSDFDGYGDAHKQELWETWKASRAALCVELPRTPRFSASDEPDLAFEEGVEVIAHRDGAAICWSTKEKRGLYTDDFEDFRPLRTERDELIEIILSCNMSEGILADAILAAGFTRKEAV